MFERGRKYLKTLGQFIGPGFMVAVGYLDPGNWATDMEGGSRFGYRLLFIILLSNIIAVFLQNLALRLGTVSGLDLASCSRRYLPYSLNLFLYILAEIAIIATDIAEVIGSAIALNLLIPSLPLPAGVAITAVDVFIVLMFYNDDDQEQDEQKKKASVKMARYFEFFVMLLVAAVGTCFVIELAFSNVVIKDFMIGFLPTKEILTQPDMLYVGIGILGATVMPHNLYLHSFIVQARCHGWRNARPHVIAKEDEWLVVKECGLDEFTTKKNDGDTVVIDVQSKFEALRDYLDTTLKHHLHYGFADLIVALSVALFVNCAILVVASANFYYGPESQEVSDLFSAHGLLLKYLGPPAATVFALALLFAGQSSTLTATLAGQVIMSGFLGMTTRPWIRRIVTRLIAITPAMIAACLAGRSGLSHMLVASQVALSIQLPFAVIPLVYFTYKKEAMSLDLVVLKKNQEKVSKPSILDYIRSIFSSSDGWVAFSETNDKEKELVQSDHSSSNSETETTTIGDEQLLKDIPAPLSYENSKLVNVFAVIVSALLVGLNSYLVVTLFMQI